MLHFDHPTQNYPRSLDDWRRQPFALLRVQSACAKSADDGHDPGPVAVATFEPEPTSRCDYVDVVRQLRTWLARSKVLHRLDFPVAASEIELRRVRAENEH